jgi:PDZ domain-containing protein
MFSSASVATVIAYEKANVELNITSEDYYVTFITEEANTNLKVGDKILKFNGEDYDPVKVANHIQSLNPGDEIKLIVKRDDKEVSTTSKIVLIEEQKFIGIVITTIKNFDKKNIVTFSPEKNESGPSGGLMMSLGIYNSITEKDITNGKKICGTGTIDYDGTVGEISGVKYKIMGANKDKCDIFLVPTENYEEAKNTKDKFKYDIEIKSVKTFDDALAYLTK